MQKTGATRMIIIIHALASAALFRLFRIEAHQKALSETAAGYVKVRQLVPLRTGSAGFTSPQ